MFIKSASRLLFVLLAFIFTFSANAATVIQLPFPFVLDPSECTDIGLDSLFVAEASGIKIFKCVERDSTTINVEASASANRFQSSAIGNQLSSGMANLMANASSDWSNNENKMSASSDLNSFLPDGAWAVKSITQISDDQGEQSDTDIYQIVGGLDKIIGNFIVGSALTYVHSEDEQKKVHTTADTVGIAPYLAYKITDYMFVSTYLAYNYTHMNAVNNASDVDINDFVSETNINFLKIIDSFVLKGRGGFRYKHTHTMLEKDVNGQDDDFDELTWIGDIEIGYQLSKKLKVYTGLLYEYRDQEVSAASEIIHDGVGFMRYGAEYSISGNWIVGAMIEHDINDEDNDFITGGLNARIVF